MRGVTKLVSLAAIALASLQASAQQRRPRPLTMKF